MEPRAVIKHLRWATDGGGWDIKIFKKITLHETTARWQVYYASLPHWASTCTCTFAVMQRVARVC